MASGPRGPSSRRNRKLCPSPANTVETVIVSNPNDDDTSVTDEIVELKRCGVLPRDFPSRDGNIEGNNERRDDQDDIAQELDVLLGIGALSVNDVQSLKNPKSDELLTGEQLQRSLNFDRNNHDIPAFDNDEIPVNWSRGSSVDHPYTLFRLHRGEQEFDDIESEFRDAHIKVKSIERIQNFRLLDKFKGEMKDMKQHRTKDFNLNIAYLYHGSNVKKETLCEEGLDQRLSRLGYFGRGIYFSDFPLKCVHYSEDCKQEGPYEAYILKCRVILGDMKIYPRGSNDIDLLREPEKEVPSHGSKKYDSVLGCPKDFNEFVVYDNRRAMIEYIITFKADDSVIRNLRHIAKSTPSAESTVTNKIEGALSVDMNSGAESEPLVVNIPNTELTVSERPEEHFSRISDVREAVRKKRLGNTYVPPSNEQQTRDKETWRRIQKLQGVKCEQEKARENLESKLSSQSNTDDSALMSELDYLEQIGPSRSYESHSSQAQSSRTYESRSRQSPLIMWNEELEEPETQDESGWPSGFQFDSGFDMYVREDNPVDQVLSVCVAEFLSVTGLEDSSLAKHYVQKSEMDVNRAISMYYEDCG